MVLDATQYYHSISLILAIFKYSNFVTFGTQTILVNEVHRASFKWFHLKNSIIKPKQKWTFWNVHNILNVLKYELTPLTLIPEESATFHKNYNRKYFLDLT